MRKEPNAPFGREGFVLEQHMDKLGANGWELVTVAGPPNDPAFYFKRLKGKN
jgi:NAD(P)H-flavin reductase